MKPIKPPEPGTEEKRDVPDYLEIQLPVVLVFM